MRHLRLSCLKPEERPVACGQTVGMGREEGTGRALGMTLKKVERLGQRRELPERLGKWC